MFRSVAAFELRYQLKSPAFWVTFLIFGLLTFGATASDNVQIGSGGNVLVNSPYAIAQTLMVMSLFAVFIMTAFVANVVVRDDETGFGPIIHATRITRFDYLFGRFSGAFLAGCLAFLSVPLGMMIGAAMPWLDPETVGPFNLWHYAWIYFCVCVPTLFVTGAGFFAIATATRSMMWTYVGVIGFLVLYFVAATYFSRPEFERTVALVEPFGLGAFGQATKYWTATERNTQLPEFAGHILWNRVIWTGVAFALLGLAWRLYVAGGARRDDARPQGAAKRSNVGRAGARGRPRVRSPPPRPDAAVRRDGSGWSQLWALAKFDVAAAIRSPAFIVLLGIGFLNAIASLWFADEIYGNTIYPVTRVMIETLQGAFTIIPLIIAIYYAGELVWRDRDRRMHEIIDSTPAPDWAFVVPKILAISLVLFATLAASTLAAIAVQALKGYFHFELGKYLAWYVLPTTVGVVMFAVLAIFMQVLVPQKALGWLLMLRVPGGPGEPRPPRLPAQPLPVREQPRHAALGHERAGRLRPLRVVVPRLLDRCCAAARGARLRAVAPWRRRAAQEPPCAAAEAAVGRRGRSGGRVRAGDGRPRRLDLLQHQRAERVPHDARRRAPAGGLREGADRLRERAAAADHRRHARGRPLSSGAARRDAGQLPDPEPHRPAAARPCTCAGSSRSR